MSRSLTTERRRGFVNVDSASGKTPHVATRTSS
jgi:hypothetical protein